MEGEVCVHTHMQEGLSRRVSVGWLVCVVAAPTFGSQVIGRTADAHVSHVWKLQCECA